MEILEIGPVSQFGEEALQIARNARTLLRSLSRSAL
jgi:hypothetical protein